jgi:mono/diheme cytochrome c family protein
MARLAWLFMAVALGWSALPARAAQVAPRPEEPAAAWSGEALFKTYCATCHGPSAKGDGPLAGHLRFRPPDLTLFAKRNGGKFAAEKVGRIIDGRDPVKGHGGPDMPVWGDAFKGAHEGYSEASVKARIKALVEFLEGLQVK